MLKLANFLLIASTVSTAGLSLTEHKRMESFVKNDAFASKGARGLSVAFFQFSI
jgi:hypothetical protein